MMILETTAWGMSILLMHHAALNNDYMWLPLWIINVAWGLKLQGRRRT